MRNLDVRYVSIWVLLHLHHIHRLQGLHRIYNPTSILALLQPFKEQIDLAISMFHTSWHQTVHFIIIGHLLLTLTSCILIGKKSAIRFDIIRVILSARYAPVCPICSLNTVLLIARTLPSSLVPVTNVLALAIEFLFT